MKNITEKKVTIATIKSFVKNNINDLYIKVVSDFDGMTDCVASVNGDFRKANPNNLDLTDKHSMGLSGIWFVGSSRDYINKIENGFEIYNCCGTFLIVNKI